MFSLTNTTFKQRLFGLSIEKSFLRCFDKKSIFRKKGGLSVNRSPKSEGIDGSLVFAKCNVEPAEVHVKEGKPFADTGSAEGTADANAAVHA